jgi:hypothetical protein
VKKIGLLLITVLLAGFAGCVSIHDGNSLQVTPPGQTDQYQRNVLDKCPPHINPHRLIIGEIATGSPLVTSGSQFAKSQQEFDNFWPNITVQSMDPVKVPLNSLTQEPIVNWSSEMAYFLLVPIDNTCQKTRPYGDEMISDCYDITVPLYRTYEGQNCGAPGAYPVFIFIYSKTNLPVSIQWIFPTPTPTFSPAPTATSTPTRTPTPEEE